MLSWDPIAAEFEGSLSLLSNGQVLFDLGGELNGLTSRLSSSAAGSVFLVEAEGRRVEIRAPLQFRGALAAGFVHLGLLDVVLRILSGRTPPSADGIRRQYRLEPFAEVEAEPSRPDLADCHGYAFTVREHDIEVATATLWVERVLGLPRERSQTIRAPARFSATEIYWGFEEATVLRDRPSSSDLI